MSDRAEHRVARILAALEANDWQEVRDRIEDVGELLATSALGAEERVDLERRVVTLARHEKWEVRRAVARVAQHVRRESCFSALALLADDENTWVRDAARRSLADRTEGTSTDVLQAEHEKLWRRWLQDLEVQHGTRARDAARRVAEKFTELVVREAYHELVKAVAPVELSFNSLKRGLKEKRISREQCLKHVRRGQRRLKLVHSIVASLRDFVTEVVPEFQRENLHDVIRQSLTNLNPRGRSRLKVTVVIDRDFVLDAHRERLVQAFSNLLQNALEAYDGVEREPRVRIEAVADPDTKTVTLKFTDKGCGMSDEARSERLPALHEQEARRPRLRAAAREEDPGDRTPRIH